MIKITDVKFSLIVLCLLCCTSIQPVTAQPSRFSSGKYISTDGDTLNYRLLYPDYDTIRKYPLVIFLHGSGERGSDNEAQLKWGVMNFATDQAMIMYPAYVLAPQCPSQQWWSNFDEQNNSNGMKLRPSPSKPMKLVIGLVRQLARTLQVDTSRIYITGLSMGGYGTYDAIERYPGMFAAAVPVCGGGDVSKASSIAHIPIWIFHGAEDPAVSTMYSLEMAEALNKAGAHPGLTIYPATGHFSWLGAYSNPLMMEWMFSQHK